MDVHDGHRQRLKKRFAEYGLDNFEDINAIELLLFYAVPRRDTNTLAHALIDRFGGLCQVLEAPVSELMKVDGVGENTALLLKLIPQVSRRYQISKNKCGNETILSSTMQAGNYILPLFMFETSEVAYLICLDSKCKVICCKKLSQGVVNAAEVSVRRIVEIALNNQAVSVIMAHNHTCGLALPSREDEMTTQQIAAALATVGIALKDHIIVAGEDYISFADSGLIRHR